MKAYYGIHTSVPCDEEGYNNERPCKEQGPEGGLVEHVERKAGLGGNKSILGRRKKRHPGRQSQPVRDFQTRPQNATRLADRTSVR